MTGLGGYDCESLDYALHHIIRHLSEAEPSADLHEALLNTCYITVLIKLETFDYSNRVADLLAGFLFFLKSSVSVFIPSVLPDSLFAELHRYKGSLSPSS